MDVLASLPVLTALLHEGGWDEALMVGVGLVIAYFIIVWTGRRSRDVDDDEQDEDVLPGTPESPDQAAERPR
ncbi:MAG: hypothetical protein IT305_20830 [Chloroflexi bacterium]|nr:hypothetical protein [Chloroflexota bacterium]